MVSGVLLLSYLDKIGLTLTGEAEQAAGVYIVKRGYIREPEWRLFLSRPHHVLQATSPCVKKVGHRNTRETVRA